jgi:AcrR family transcriptional regulator
MHPVKGSPGQLHSTEDALILSATHCFSAKGFSATSIQDIASHAGVAKGNVYHYFTSKDDVLRLILHRVLDDLLGGVDDLPYDELNPVDQLHAFMGEMVDLVARNRDGVAIFVQERRWLSEEGFEDVLARAEEMPERLTVLLQRGIDDGSFRPLTSVKAVALGLIGMATWAYQWYQPGRIKPAELARIYADLVIDGVGVGGSVAVGTLQADSVPTPDPDTKPSTRDALVRAALELFVAQGYDNTSIQNLSVRAGVTTGAFYSQFSSKDEILRYIDNHFLDRLLGSFGRIFEQKLSSSETLAQLLMETVGGDGEHQSERVTFLNGWRFFNTDTFADVRAKSTQFLDGFVAALEKGERDGVFRSLSAPRLVAAGLVGMCSFPYQWMGPGGVIEPDAATAYADVVLNGLRNRAD